MKVSIIIVTWNSGPTLSGCVGSLLEWVKEPAIEIVIVDNDSADKGYLDAFRSHPICKVVVNPANLGFAKANNIGASIATGDYLLILNPDMVLVSNPLPALLAALNSHPEVGAIAPLLVDESGSLSADGYYYKFPDFLQTLLVRTYLVRLEAVRRLARRLCQSRVPAEGLGMIDQIPGAFLLFRRSTVPDPMVLDERYFIWMEDVDFCRRLADRGLKVAIQADERAVHIGGASFRLWSDRRKRRISMESFLAYLRLHHGRFRYAADSAILILNSAVMLGLVTLKNMALGRPSKLKEGVAAESAELGLLLRGLHRVLALRKT